MYIQEVVIDGFKSYAHRTVVEGFDPHFNAITGLNGSGKSNILDSICFVLGITNLSQVRAGNLSELVYKQGQAGVNKASVTIIFNNEDESSSPVAYEQCPEVTVTRQVLLGGKSKYSINGRNSSAGQVQNLFHSVQLNVNNPHFLIMQGRITKVLNMKPNEILGMVEEAAGTRMYETKRVAAIKTIDKKQAKVDELNSVLSEEITPTLERLRGEKHSYLKWSKNNADIERIERFVIASNFMKAQEALESNKEGFDEMEDEVAALEEEAKGYEEQIAEKDREARQLSDRLNGEFDDSQKSLKQAEEKRSKELVKVTSAWQNSKELTKNAENDLATARKVLDETEQALALKEKESVAESKSIEHRLKAREEAERDVERLTSDFQSMSAGLTCSQGEEGLTLPDQIAKAHSDSKTAEAKVKQATMKMKHLTKELESVEKKLKKEQKSAKVLNAKRDRATEREQGLRSAILDLAFDEEEFSCLEREKDQLAADLAEWSDLIDVLTAKLENRLAFRYADPVRGFDRSKVKGMVANLIKVNKAVHSTALEVVAGGKLYQVVVDEAVTGKAILDRGKLERRVTIIPLDKIRPRSVTETASRRASDIAESMNTEAWPAIELVGFDEEVRIAMEYVFGSSIVVDGSKAANQICDSTKTRTVTLEGDVYDPSGTISGGSKNNLGTTLSELSKLANLSSKHDVGKKRLLDVRKRLDLLKKKSSEFDKLKAKLEIAEAELQAIQKHLSQTSYGVLEEKFNRMTSELKESEKQYEEMQKKQESKWLLYHELKEREEELTQERENRLGEIESAVKEAKKQVVQTEKAAREAQSTLQTLTLELDGLKQEVTTATESVDAAHRALQATNIDEDNLQMKVGEAKALYDDAKAELDNFENCLAEYSSQLSELKHTKAALTKAAEKCTLQAKKLSVTISRIQKERAGAEKLVADLLKKNIWIESERSAFGVAGGDYDFTATDPSQMSKQLQALKSEQDALSKKINKKVLGMIEKAEGEYTELLRKRKVVENDKKKIKSVIEELDVKKKSELERTWKKVNRDFGSIFSTLLPGASAKLEPPEGLQAWEGLEVKVGFGDVWKESLSELSGGQRSLLALSLILSLLLFKPAPMYILDEVDAALDMSHTQNIGNMLKTHFSQSQFIVVSLKEGMFNNANVIFRTKFVDGVSTVARTIGTGSSKARTLTQSRRNEEGESQQISRKRVARAGNLSRGKENAML